MSDAGVVQSGWQRLEAAREEWCAALGAQPYSNHLYTVLTVEDVYASGAMSSDDGKRPPDPWVIGQNVALRDEHTFGEVHLFVMRSTLPGTDPLKPGDRLFLTLSRILPAP